MAHTPIIATLMALETAPLLEHIHEVITISEGDTPLG